MFVIFIYSFLNIFLPRLVVDGFFKGTDVRVYLGERERERERERGRGREREREGKR